MAIEVKHGVGGAALAGAFVGGRAQATDRRSARLSQLAAGTAARRAAAVQAEKNREFQDEQAGFAEDFRASESEKARTFQAGQSELSDARASQRVYDNAFNQDLVNQLQQERLSEQQKADLEKEAEAIDRAKQSGDFDEADIAEMELDHMRKLAGLKSTPRPKEKTQAEKDKENTYLDKETGILYSRDERGVPDKTLYNPHETEVKKREVAAKERKADLDEKNARLNAHDKAMAYMATHGVGTPEKAKEDQKLYDDYMARAGFGKEEPVVDPAGGDTIVDPAVDPNAQPGAAVVEPRWPSEIAAAQEGAPAFAITGQSRSDAGVTTFTVRTSDGTEKQFQGGAGRKLVKGDSIDQIILADIYLAAGKNIEQAEILARKLGYDF